MTVLAITFNDSNTLYLNPKSEKDCHYLMTQIIEFESGQLNFKFEDMEQSEFEALDEWEP